MKKNATKTKGNQASNASQQRTLRLAGFVKRNLYGFIIEEGMKALEQLLEADREQLCGPAHHKGDPGEPVRWGRCDGRLGFGGPRSRPGPQAACAAAREGGRPACVGAVR
jgi:hypothetical protein